MDKAKVVELLRNIHGEQVILFDERGREAQYHLVKEIEFGNHVYAVLSKTARGDEDDLQFLRVTGSMDGSYELETIDDDDEWESVSEAYDELFYKEEEE